VQRISVETAERAQACNPSRLGLRYNKLCELEDFEHEEFRRYAREIYSRPTARLPAYAPGREHRKIWEVVQAARSLVDLGAVHERADLLGVAAGTEATIFWATNHARRVFATDLYLAAGSWDEDAPRSMLVAPGEHAPCAWNPSRLIVEHMDALDLRYADDSFDGVFCSSSLEHFGETAAISQALSEIWRVLRPGGIASLSTEFRIRGPGPGLPGTLLFNAVELDRLIVRPYAWEVVGVLELGLSARTRATEVRLDDALAGTAPRFPHVVVSDGNRAWTSVHMALRKAPTRTGSYCRLHAREDASDWQARRQIRSGWDWCEIRARVHERDGICVRCGSTRRLHVHHRVPLRYGGSNDIGNLELLCARCHGQ
jgi:5-methylcytosine-specific restriction endonuclease McrA